MFERMWKWKGNLSLLKHTTFICLVVVYIKYTLWPNNVYTRTLNRYSKMKWKSGECVLDGYVKNFVKCFVWNYLSLIYISLLVKWVCACVCWRSESDVFYIDRIEWECKTFLMVMRVRGEIEGQFRIRVFQSYSI